MTTTGRSSIPRSGWILFLAAAAMASAWACRGGRTRTPSLANPELEYLKAVNQQPPQDPQMLFLLMAQFANANRHREGAEFLQARRDQFEPRLTDAQKSLYLSAIAALRAGAANDVPFVKRIGWVNDTIGMLQTAKKLSGGNVFIVRWVSGVVSAQLPGIFRQKATALEDLNWCVAHAGQAPAPEFLNEVYLRLANLYRKDGHAAKADEYLKLSGAPRFDTPTTQLSPFREDPVSGHTFSAKRIAEVVPGNVYALSGYEFTEFYFVVSEDGRELIAIDAGTRPDSAQAAYEALRARAPNLPQLTTVLVTHSHWDHVGGHRYFRSLKPNVKFYARENYAREMARMSSATQVFGQPFFGSRFRMEEVLDFRPDVTLGARTQMRVGGTRIEAIPAQGGETQDALMFFLPDQGVMFVGDIIMPYLGAPFIEEGNLQGLLDAIDVVVQINPKVLLHGHEPLTRVFASPEMLGHLKTHLAWLQDQVLAAIRRGEERAAIQQANLIPPGLVEGDFRTHQPYLLLRENVINRLYDQNVGYWQPDLQGVDYVSRADRGALLVDYLGVSEDQMVGAAKRMIADGNYELAAEALDWTRGRFAVSQSFRDQERLAYEKLMEKYQAFNPFKFIIYSWRAESPPPSGGR
jgi:glyoxylase-like metal-dependent hydrolase (beta-lactamase superfamily II)